MSATVYSEPYRLPAGILAMVVHIVFFALLYLGFNWNRQPFSPATMSVELWPDLPDGVTAAPVNPKVAESVKPPPQEKIIKPDIAMPDKKKPDLKAVEVAKPRPDTPKPAEVNPEARLAEQKAASAQAERIKQQEEQTAAINKLVDEYKAKITAKIKRNIGPTNVERDASVIFLVTLLPGGAVLKVELKKSSGNEAYDNAVERAIRKSDPLPLPPDVQLFNRFRELNLVFKPTE